MITMDMKTNATILLEKLEIYTHKFQLLSMHQENRSGESHECAGASIMNCNHDKINKETCRQILHEDELIRQRQSPKQTVQPDMRDQDELKAHISTGKDEHMGVREESIDDNTIATFKYEPQKDEATGKTGEEDQLKISLQDLKEQFEIVNCKRNGHNLILAFQASLRSQLKNDYI